MCEIPTDRKRNNLTKRKRQSNCVRDCKEHRLFKWKLALAQYNHNQVVALSSTVDFKYPRVWENDGKMELVLKLKRLIIFQDNTVNSKNYNALF